MIHDRGDAEVPWQHGLAITHAWPRAGLLTTDGTAERGIRVAAGEDPQATPLEILMAV